MAILGLNQSSQTATYFLSVANAGLNRSISRLSSGTKFAIPGDTPGASAAASVDQAVRRMGTVLEGVQALSQFQSTADSYMSSVQDAVNSLRELADRAQSAAYTSAERLAFDGDFQGILTKTRTMITAAQYAGVSVVNGGAAQSNSLGGQFHLFNIFHCHFCKRLRLMNIGRYQVGKRKQFLDQHPFGAGFQQRCSMSASRYRINH